MLSLTMKKAALASSMVHGGGKRRAADRILQAGAQSLFTQLCEVDCHLPRLVAAKRQPIETA